MVYVVIWLFCGITVAMIAGSKNRNVIGWFLLGFLFGPFAFIIAFLPKVETSNAPVGHPVSKAPRVSVEDLAKKCPSCAEPIKFEAVKCRFCGHEFDSDLVKLHINKKREFLEEKASAGLIECPKCQKWDAYKDARGSYFCPHCKAYVTR